MQRLKRLFRLARRRRYLLIQALVITCVIRLTLSFLTVQRFQGLRKKISALTEEAASVDEIVWAVQGAAGLIPGANCLVKALAAQLLLIRHGYRPRLTIGVQKNKPNRFSAHAWITCGGEILIGGQHARNYISLLNLES